MKKRLLAAIMSLCMIVSLLPVSALAYESADMSEERNRSITMQIGERHQMTDAHTADTSLLNEEHIWSAEPAGYVAFDDSNAHRSTITALKAGTVTITHRYWQKSGILGLDGDYEVENWTVNIVRNTEIYFFLLKPGEYTIESDQGNDYYYLLHGGQVTDRAADLEEEVPEIDLVNESTIKDYVKSWPTGGFDTGNDEMSSDPVESGSTWSLGNNGTVSSFTLVLKDAKTQETTKYSSNPGESDDGHAYGIRWVKIGYVGNDGTESGNKYHLDGVLYKKVLAQEVLEEGLYKEFVANSHPSLGGDGNPQNQETFQFTLDAAKDTTNAFDDIPLTATISTSSVKLTFEDSTNDANQELPVGNYVVREDLKGEQDKAWQTPNSIEFSVNSDGSITFVNNNQTITNTLETYTLSYDANGGTGAPTNSTHKYNEKTSVAAEKPTREGYEFLGWDSGTDGNADYQPNAPIQIKENVELVAVWEKVLTENLSIEKTVKLLNGETPVDIPDEGVKVNDTLQYNVTVTNNGTAVQDVVVMDTMFPNDGTSVTVTSNKGTTPSVDWSMGSATITSELAKDESVTFTYMYPVTEQDQNDNSIFNEASVWLNHQKKDFDNVTVSVSTETYTLTYDANGGYFGEDQTVTTKEETNDINVRTLNRTPEYTPKHAPSQDGGNVNVLFLGWTTEDNNEEIYSKGDALPDLVENNETVTVSADGTSIFAVWGYDADNTGTADVLERTVTFDAQGGTPVPSQTVKVGKTATKPTDPTKAGFTFAEWYLEGATTPYDFSTPVTEDITLVAHWTDATQYTVTFDPNGGSLTSAPTVTVPPNTPVTKPADPVWNDDYIFMGWTTEPILGKTYGVGENLPGMVFQNSNTYTPTGTTILYAVWGEDSNHDDVADVYEVFIAPADITIYTGGTGYEGVSDGDGNEIENSNSGLPEPGFHIILPADLGLGDGNVLNGIVKFQYYGWDDITDNTVRREWDLSCVGVYSAELGQFVYSLESTGDTPAVRVTYTGENGEAVEHDRIDMSANAASAKYDMSINTGGLTPSAIQAVITTADGTPETRSLVIGTGELTIRSTVDRTDNTNTIADNAGEVSDGSFNAVGNNASYVVNDSEVPVPTEGDRVQLLVDQVSDSAEFNNAMGEAALDHPQVNGTAFETAYLDLVDTQNGNTVVTLNTGSMDIYWPMPSNADPSGTFQVVHYYNMNRETTVDDTALDTQASEVLTGTPEYRNGDWYVRFTTHSFSPFVLVYEEDTSRPVNPNPGGGSGGDSDSDPTGNLSIELDVNGGDDEFTFTVILTDKDGDDLENNFYYNGDYTGTIGSGDEITLTGGDKIVIRNLPEGTRYEVIIETADGYTYVIDGEEGVIHTGMNEAEFTATRTVPVADPSVTGVSRWLNTTDHIAYLTGYPGGAFGPDNNMTRAEVAQMFYALLNNKNVTITKTFPDVPADAWYATAVNTLASLGMVSGDENGNYRPNDPITRAEFCVIALAFAYEPENAVCYFGDVSRSDWFYTYVAQAASYGWIGGYTNGNFGPNDRITRAQVTTIVNNMLGRAADRDYVIDHQADLVQFTDLTRAHWGYFQIMEATNAHDYTKSNGTENWR